MERYDMTVELQGRIISKRIHPSKAIGSLILDTTASAKNPSLHNTPHVMFFSNPEQLNQYERGDFVYIKGYLASYVNKDKKRRQSIVATELSPAKSRIEREYHGAFGNGALYDRINQFRIIGTYIGRQDVGNVTNLFVRVVKNGHNNHIMLKVFRRPYVDKILDDLKWGDTICAMGTIQTKPTKDNKYEYFENPVAMELTKVPKAAS